MFPTSIHHCLVTTNTDNVVNVITQSQFDVNSELVLFSVGLSIYSFVSVSSSAIGARATRAAVMLCLACAVRLLDRRRISASMTSTSDLRAVIASLTGTCRSKMILLCNLTYFVHLILMCCSWSSRG